MKISDTLKNAASYPDVLSKDVRRSDSIEKAGFLNQLSNIEEQNFDQKIQELVNKIIVQGEKLSDKIDIGELRKYKSLISEFLDRMLSGSFRFSKESFVDKRGRHKVFSAVKKINSELDELTSEVMINQTGNIAVLKKISDIRGLIMDIFL